MTAPAEGFVVLEARRTNGRRTELLAELPDPRDLSSGMVSYLTGRTVTLPGFAPSLVWGPLDMAGAWPKAEATKRARRVGRHAMVVDAAAAAEWQRIRHLTRAKAKARKL